MHDRWTLSGKRAVITGGTKGIGRAAAESFMELGARVLVVGRDAGTVEATRSAWRAEGRDGDAVVADVTTPAGRAALAEQVDRRWGALDILVNNVGAGLRKPAVELSEEDVDGLVARNFTSALHVSQLLFPLLCAGRDAAVVNVGSVAGIRSVRGAAVYGALKAALHHLTLTLAVEWAPRKIRVNAVAGALVHADAARPGDPGAGRRASEHRGADATRSRGRGRGGRLGDRHVPLARGLVRHGAHAGGRRRGMSAAGLL